MCAKLPKHLQIQETRKISPAIALYLGLTKGSVLGKDIIESGKTHPMNTFTAKQETAQGVDIYP